jgi:hypothetical protein
MNGTMLDWIVSVGSIFVMICLIWVSLKKS